MNHKKRREGEGLGSATPGELSRRRDGGEITWALLIAIGAVIGLVVLSFFVARRFRTPAPVVYNGLAAASKPLPVAKTPTERDVRARFRAFDLRQWLEGYQERGLHGATADPETEKFIRAFFDRADGEPGAGDSHCLETESGRLAHDPSCTDPLVLSLVANGTLNWYDRVEIYKRALAAFPSSGHLAYPALYADVNLMNESKHEYDLEGELNTSALALLAQCFTDGSFQTRDQQEIASLFIDSWGYTFFSRNDGAVCDIIHQAGPQYHWLALVMDGERYIIDAWNARGGGTSDSVNDEQRSEFKRLLTEGAKRLTEAWTLHPDYPIAPSLMVYDSLGTGVDTMRMWFDRALSAQIDYPAAWINMRWGLRPRWYGSIAAELALGRLAINTGRFDTDIPRQYFDCISDVENDWILPRGMRIYAVPEVWSDLQRMYEGYIAEPTQARDRNGWRSAYAAVAYLSGHYDVVRKQLEALNWKLAPAALTSWGVDLTPMPLEVAARTGPLGEGISEAEATRIAGDRAGALRMYTELDSRHTTDDRTQKFIQLRLSRLTYEQHFEDGKWVSLMPASDQDPDWLYSFGDVRKNADGSVDVEYGPKGHMLYPRMQVGGNFEVRGKFEVIRSSNTNFQAGIVIGAPDIETYNWYGFRMKRHDREGGDIVTFGLGWSLREMSQRVLLDSKSNSFDLVLNEGRVTASVNGDKIFDQAEEPAWIDVAPRTYFVGLGAFSDSADAVVRYEGVELRKLSPVVVEDVPKSEFGEPTPQPTGAAPKTLAVPEQIAADRQQMESAIERVKDIVNQPAFSLPIKEGMNITWWSDTWFHPGATIPNYAKVDISKTQQFPYSKYEYVASSQHPDTAFLGSDLEFNEMTKLFYVDRSVPKRRLTHSEMAEINGLYRIIGRCRADLKLLGAK